MDVVKAQAAAIGGRVSVASTRGAGTRFTIHIPLTLAVTRALLVQSGGRTWAIPSSLVAQAMELKPAPLRTLQEQHGYAWQGEHFPYRYLPRLLGDRDARPLEQRYNWVLLLRAGAQRLALHVDGLRGNQDIVVKNAGPQLTRVVGMSGATVLGDGEVVIILNPVALASRGLGEQEIDSIHLPPESEAPPPLHLPTVMVVDDSLTVRKITGRLLEREGYRVITAKDGVDALEQLIDTLPDVVLSDIEMPRMDGFDLVRNIRADKRLQHLPVIMITSRLAEKHRRYAEEIGANHYLGKPYQEEELLALVAGYITGQTQAPA
jgi:chemosensory pili system protein ChpA (sensor histidine kinase/response regulator)